MMRRVAYAGIALVVLLSFTALSQSTEKPPAFTAIDIRVAAPSPIPQMSGGAVREGRFELRNGTMVDLIRTAYGVDADKVLGGPNWLESTRFDIITTVPAGTTTETARLMLRALLAERFDLKVHDDQRPLPAFVLTAPGNKPKMKPSDGSAPAGCQGIPPATAPQPGTIGYANVGCRNLTSEQIAQNLRQMAGGYLDKPVIDQTKLEGAWDFELKWTARAQLGAAGPDGISLFDAVDKQLGLKLEQQQISMPVIIVDNVNQKPTDSRTATATNIVAEKPEFEAAEIKPSEPGSQGIMIRYTPGGRIDAMGSLRQLVGIAYEIPPNLAADMLAGGPKFMDTERYNILAKAPSTGIGAPGRDGGRETAPPIQVALAMLRNLLEERFKLKTHKEDRPVSAYAIIQLKGEQLKLKKADPATRSSCRPDPGAAQTSKTPMQAITCQNTTMAELARNIQTWAAAYFDHPVVDKTGLEGGYDFTFMWSPRGALEAPVNRPADAPGGGVAAVDPGGGISAFDALEKLGLKAERGTHSFSVLVIDNIEQKPID